MARLTAEEKRNALFIKDMFEKATQGELDYFIIPSGCHVEIRCNNVETIECAEIIINDLIKEHQLESIRGSIRVTYNKFLKA